MSTAILVASFACFFLDSVCFRHFSFNGILKGGSPLFPMVSCHSLWFAVAPASFQHLTDAAFDVSVRERSSIARLKQSEQN